jgi:hypothetical protein
MHDDNVVQLLSNLIHPVFKIVIIIIIIKCQIQLQLQSVITVVLYI